ncbi:Ribose-5-phosphate isomerase A [Neochlamydia sp. TUME1]|uniref:ribose 5-phosphate isomerase A n=1 Tax=Neochlamydia sp. TUME1 TaxID=1478174 RepID=UPI0005809A43|nr:ribose 5-phosphate isomerase A [Neochlamydia sp. TUME1]KIC75961.1 Ribose-5-phosphate isomerase A [Neochlamydia sp. TUME1]
MSDNSFIGQQIAKKSAGYAAANLVENGMTVGLGTGSTTSFFIEKLAQRCEEGLKIQAVATSSQSQKLALEKGIPLIDINTLFSIDLTVDGADEIDPDKTMIKGGGGALLREKIVASMSKEAIIIVDQAKLVKKLGQVPLPVEIVPFAYPATIYRIEQLGYQGKLRTHDEKELYCTDNGNYIYDIYFKEKLEKAEQLHQRLSEIVGVVESGLFIRLAGRIIVGYNDGEVKIFTELK